MSIVFILASVVLVIILMVPAVYAQYGEWLYTGEWYLPHCFIEYALRLWSIEYFAYACALRSRDPGRLAHGTSLSLALIFLAIRILRRADQGPNRYGAVCSEAEPITQPPRRRKITAFICQYWLNDRLRFAMYLVEAVIRSQVFRTAFIGVQQR